MASILSEFHVNWQRTLLAKKSFIQKTHENWHQGTLDLQAKTATVSKEKWKSHSVVSDSLWPHGLYSPWNSPGQNTGVDSLAFLQGIFPTQGSNPGLPHCRQILYQLSHKGSPRILEWVASPFSRGVFLTHESNWGLLHCGCILYQPSYQGNLSVRRAMATTKITGESGVTCANRESSQQILVQYERMNG